MDERHWWIATKVQETFRVCGKDSPTELESFFTQPEHLELVDEFLKADGLGKLFFYASTENQEEIQLSSLNIVENLDKITDSQNVHILYFIRHKTQFDIDPIRMEQDIFCGEIRKSVIDSLRSLVNDIYIPLLKAQKDWGICSQPNVAQFLSSLDKYAIVLHDSAAVTRSEKQQILKRPVRLVSAELMQQRMMVFDSEIISENETILSDWMKTLEEILKEGGDDRILDINTTPITELDRWRRRQRTLESIMEQLKGKECKNVIGLLIATKSRLLKKWKALDISITDIANDTKGKVKYLEALSRHFEALANENNPANLMNTVLPGIFTAFKQMDTVSRFLSRNGYLGLLLTKLCCSHHEGDGGKPSGRVETVGEPMGSGLLGIRTGVVLRRRLLHICTQVPISGGPYRVQLRSSRLPPTRKMSLDLARLQDPAVSNNFARSLCEELADLGATVNLNVMWEIFRDKTLKDAEGCVGVTSVPRRKCFISQGTLDIIESSRRARVNGKSGLYWELRRIAARDLRADKEAFVRGICEQVTHHLWSTEPCPAYRGIEVLRTTESVPRRVAVRAADGTVLLDDTAAVTRWAGYFEKLFKAEYPARTLPIISCVPHNLTEIAQVVNRLRGGKAAGICRIRGELLQTGGKAVFLALQAIFASIWETGIIPTDCDRLDYSNYRGIKLLLVPDHDYHGAGVSLTDEESIMHNLDAFCYKLRQFCHVLVTLHQADFAPHSSESWRTGLNVAPLQTLIEEDEGQSSTEIPVSSHELNCERLSPVEENTDSLRHESDDEEQNEEENTLSFEEKKILQNLYNWDDPEEEGQCLPSVINEYLANLIQAMSSGITADVLLNVEKRETDKFEDAYSEFLVMNQALERYITVYMQAVFLRKMRTVEAIAFLKRFTAVSQRQSIQPMITECYVEALNWFYDEIKEVQETYERHKVFKEMKVKISSYSYSQTVKLYNRIAAALVTYETLWYQEWKSRAEGCLRGLNATLLIRDPNTQEHLVNSDQRLKHLAETVLRIKEDVIDGILAVIYKSVLFNGDELLSGLIITIHTTSSLIHKLLTTFPSTCITETKEYFYGEICHAIFGCIFHSLLVLAYVSGCEMSRITKATLNSQKRHHSAAFKDTDNVSKKNNTFTMFTENYLSEFLLNHAPSNQLRCHLKLRLTIPNITIDPSLEVAQEALKESASVILNITDIVRCWPGKSKDQVLSVAVKEDEDIKVIVSHIGHVISNLKPVIEKHIFSYSYYDFLWKDDLNSQFSEMTSKNPEHFIITREVERLQSIEGKIQDIPAVFQGGCIWLDCSLIKDSLAGFAGVWKFTYASVLHQEARERLNEILQYRNKGYQQLMTEVQSLKQLNNALCLLEELQDMENKIDMIYQPVERMYKQLRSYQMRLSRDETTEVDNLRENWAELMSLAENVRKKLLKEKKIIFEQELDKQVKSFSVDVIQLRNLFDTRGPAAPGLRPEEAVYQLQRFQEKFSIYDVKQKTLNSLQRLFGVTMTAFPELDRTGKVRDYWSQCQAWNDQLTDWDAYNEMARQIKFYIDCIPMLHILATKEIRNRHWLQVMAVTGSSFPLEATVFKLHHLLDIDLLKHQEDIISIAKAATEELQLEMKMRTIEDEWTEHVLNFELYKNYGPVLLVKEDTLQTLEQVENTRVLLAQMLTSKHIGPLREDAASWSEKLKEVGMVLEIWIEVQDMWHNLEPIFTIPSIWKCCCAEEASKEFMLKHMFTDLETCCQSLAMFLGRKRQAFPRFYFLPDFVLLSFLSCPTDFSLLCNHFSLIFSGIHNVRLESSSNIQGSSSSAVEQLDTMMLPGLTERLGSASVQSLAHYTDNESVVSRSARSIGLSVESPVSTNNTDPKNSLQIVSVISKDGESLDLTEEVPLSSAIEEWLAQLQKVIATTLETCIGKAASDVRQGVNVDEWTYKYPFQIARLALLYCWTADCEAAIIDLKSDRKAFPGVVKKYSGIIFRLSSILSKKTWKHNNDPVTCSQKQKVENMVMFAVYLRDVLESLNTRKVRDVTDFEWRRSLRFYWDDNDGNNAHRLCIHDAQYESGFEFYGASVNITLSPVTEKAFFALSHILKSGNGVIVQGDHSSGKTETVKIVLNQNFSLFLTAQSKTEYKSLPSDILALFRTVSLTLPGYSLIFKAHLTALGFKSPKMLSHRLQLVTDLIKDQLPEKIHHYFSLASLKMVLYRAAQKKDIDQEERTEGRQDKVEIKPETGRTSQCSSITSAQALVASAISPSLSLRMVQSPDKRGKTASSNAMTPVARLEHALIGETLHECLAPRMEGDDLLVFSQIVRDVFGDIVDLSNQDSYFQSSPNGLEKAILKAAKNNNLIPHTPWVNKVKQLFTLSQVNQGMFMQLSSGEHIHLNSNMHLLFETCDLELATPSSISQTVLSKVFNTALDPIFNYVLREIKYPIPLTEVGLFQTISNLLGAMLNDKAQSLGGQLHIERLFLFCLIWTVGGLLQDHDKKKFSDVLKIHSTSLPDYDEEISVFDYYVDESGEWELWTSHLSEQNRAIHTDVLGEVFIETVDTLAVRTFMEYANMASQNILLVGPPGCGKTTLLNDFISGQGFVYGARDGKTLQMLIEDINLPESQCCGEFLRQILDDKMLLKLNKPFEWRLITDLVVQATISLPEFPNDNSISKRLLRNFAVLYLPSPEGAKLKQVIFSVLQLQRVEQMHDVQSYVRTYLQQYNGELENDPLQVELSENTLALMVRIHRVLSYSHSGNVVIIGSPGSYLRSLLKLSLYIAGVPLLQLDTSHKANFFSCLKLAIQQAATESKASALLLTARELEDPFCLDIVNSILISGEYSSLFSTEEMQDLVKMLNSSIQREQPLLVYDPYNYLASKVKLYIHFLICLPPHHKLLGCDSQ
ncbi:DYHG protein, partial [Polypterus senegalus]